VKALRSPWVTGVLVLVALAVIFFQVIKPQLDRRRPSRAKAPAAATKPVTAKTPPTPKTSKTKSAPPPKQQLAVARQRTVLEDNTTALMPVDRQAAADKFPRWIEAPRRDPFLLVSLEDDGTPGASSPIAQWRLSGIWNQTGSRVAAINSKVYTEGELVEGYKLEKIDADQVWLVVSNRLERLGIVYIGSHNAPKPKARTRR
jgi:hypothetical protein